MNFVPIATKIDHLRPERQYTSVRACNTGASYGLDCEALCDISRFIANIPLEQLDTHHSWFHSSDRLILGIMGHIGCAVEEIIDSVSSICSDGRAAVRPSNRFTGYHCIGFKVRIDSNSVPT